MKLNKIKEIIGEPTSTKKIKEVISKISPEDYKKEMKKKNGSIINLIKARLLKKK